MSKITFYDLASTKPNWPWGPNNWRTRYTLNYKGIPFITEWIEYPDIAEKCKSLNIPPGETDYQGNPQYCVPVIWDPKTQTGISNSFDIAKYLDEVYPDTPPVMFEGIEKYDNIIEAIVHAPGMRRVGRFIVPHVYDHVLNEGSKEYFKRTREVVFGPLEKMRPTDEEERKDLWAQVKNGFDVLDKWYWDNGKNQGPFVRGEKPTYVDFGFGGYLMWFKLMLDEDMWRDISERWNDGRWGRLHKSLEPYEQPRADTNAAAE